MNEERETRRDTQIERVRPLVIELCDELVYEDGKLTPEDAYFVFYLLSCHYSDQCERGSKSNAIVDIAWDFATDIAEYVDNDEEYADFHWINAHFVMDGVGNACRDFEFEGRLSSGESDVKTHPQGLSDENTTDTTQTIQEAVDDVVELLRFHVDIDEPSDGEAWSRSKSLDSLLSHLGKRYAHEFPDDMMESKVGFDLTSKVVEYKKSEEVSDIELSRAVYWVEDWTGLRARREHRALCVGI